MTVFTKMLLSGSTNGKNIKVAATATPGTLVHTAVSGEVNFDELWLYAYNSSASAVVVSIEFGGTASPDDLIEISIPSDSEHVLMIPGLLLQNGLVVRAFAGTIDVVVLNGYVHRITV